MAKIVDKLADTTHKERVNQFNAKLEALSEHHDIPKVGPG
jgi:protein FAM32A